MEPLTLTIVWIPSYIDVVGNEQALIKHLILTILEWVPNYIGVAGNEQALKEHLI
jgi:hypothetical protein